MKKNLHILTALLCLMVLGGCGSKAESTPTKTTTINDNEVKNIVLKHANVKEDDVTSISIRKETENGQDIYSVDFKTKEKDYEYEVARSDGEILSSEIKNLKTSSNTQTDSKDTENSNNTGNNTQNTTNNQTGTEITADKAKAIALSHAGVKESNTQLLKVRKEREDGVLIYSVEFYSGHKEYDYDIARSNGNILSYDIDEEKKTGSDTTTGISLDKARNLALQKVSGATAKNIHIELEKEDGKLIYEGEINYNRMEYEFEIDAQTGNFLKWKSEVDDD